jgi:negative regulator of PHO system
MESIPYRFENPVQAYRVLNRFGYIELINDTDRLIRVHLDPTGPMASLDYRPPVEIPDVQVFLQDRFSQGYNQRYRRSVAFRPLATYGTPQRELGAGTYGSVTEYSRSTPLTLPGFPPMNRFAIKRMVNPNELIANTTYREISSLEMLVHPNIIEMLDVQVNPDSTHLVMPLALGTLPYQSIPSHLSPSLFAPTYFKFYIYQLVRGLAHMHMMDVWHRDIKPENILLFRHPNVDGYILKYTDFGLSRNLICSDALSNASSVLYSLWYRPPEVLLGGEVSATSDVWALGITILQLVLQRALLPGTNEQDQLQRIFRFFGVPEPTSSLRHYRDWRSSYVGPQPSTQSSAQPSTQSSAQPSTQPEFTRNSFQQLFNRIPDGRRLYQMLESMFKLEPEERIDSINLLDNPYFEDIGSRVDHDPYFWAPRPLELSCEDVIQTFEEYAGYDLTSTEQELRIEVIRRIFSLWDEFNLEAKTFFVAISFVDWALQHDRDRVHYPLLLATTCLIMADDMIEVYRNPRPDYFGVTLVNRSGVVTMQQNLFPQLANHLISVTAYDFYLLDRDDFQPPVQILAKWILFVLTQTMIPIHYEPHRVSQIALGMAANLYRQPIPRNYSLPLDDLREEFQFLRPNELSQFMEINSGVTLDALVASL